jgi:hypothetical protein
MRGLASPMYLPGTKIDPGDSIDTGYTGVRSSENRFVLCEALRNLLWSWGTFRDSEGPSGFGGVAPFEAYRGSVEFAALG